MQAKHFILFLMTWISLALADSKIEGSLDQNIEPNKLAIGWRFQQSNFQFYQNNRKLDSSIDTLRGVQLETQFQSKNWSFNPRIANSWISTDGNQGHFLQTLIDINYLFQKPQFAMSFGHRYWSTSIPIARGIRPTNFKNQNQWLHIGLKKTFSSKKGSSSIDFHYARDLRELRRSNLYSFNLNTTITKRLLTQIELSYFKLAPVNEIRGLSTQFSFLYLFDL